MHHPTDRIAHTTTFVKPVVHWLEREIAQWVHPLKDRPDDPSHHERTLLARSYISLLINIELAILPQGKENEMKYVATRLTDYLKIDDDDDDDDDVDGEVDCKDEYDGHDNGDDDKVDAMMIMLIIMIVIIIIIMITIMIATISSLSWWWW